MSLIYLLALAGVCMAVVALVVEAVLSVARPARWGELRAEWAPVASTQPDRRRQQLPFVGRDRRQQAVVGQPDASPAAAEGVEPGLADRRAA